MARREPGPSNGNAEARIGDTFPAGKLKPYPTVAESQQRARRASPAGRTRPLTPLAAWAGGDTAQNHQQRSAPTPAGWRVVGPAICPRCGAIRQFGADAIAAGSVAPRECSRRSAAIDRSVRDFANAVARLEGSDAIYRRKVRPCGASHRRRPQFSRLKNRASTAGGYDFYSRGAQPSEATAQIDACSLPGLAAHGVLQHPRAAEPEPSPGSGTGRSSF